MSENSEWQLCNISVGGDVAVAEWIDPTSEETARVTVGYTMPVASDERIYELAMRLGTILFEHAEAEERIGGKMVTLEKPAAPRIPVLLKKAIRLGNFSIGVIYLEREVILPCPPFPGLIVYDSFGPEGLDEFEATIIEVAYQADKDTWEAWAPRDDTHYRAVMNGNTPPLVDTLISEWEGVGWKREGT